MVLIMIVTENIGENHPMIMKGKVDLEVQNMSIETGNVKEDIIEGEIEIGTITELEEGHEAMNLDGKGRKGNVVRGTETDIVKKIETVIVKEVQMVL